TLDYEPGPRNTGLIIVGVAGRSRGRVSFERTVLRDMAHCLPSRRSDPLARARTLVSVLVASVALPGVLLWARLLTDETGRPVYGLAAHSVEDTVRSVEALGQVRARGTEARALVETLRGRAAAVQKRVAGLPRPKVLFVVWYRPLITAGTHSFVADVIQRAGGVSISEDVQGEWPRLALEEVLHRDPDIILFPRSESFSPALDEFERLPGWKELRAVKNHRMYLVSETIIHPSPRLIDV